MYDLLVFIGRFQPLHLGHQEVIERAISLSKKVLVLVGSSNQARSVRNPFTYEERKERIQTIYPDVLVAPIHDHTYNDTAWVTEVQQAVRKQLLGSGWHADGLSDYNIGLIGCAKDHTSYYLKMFPDWATEDVKFVSPLNATAIRNMMYGNEFPERYAAAAIMDPRTYDWLAEVRHTPWFAKLIMEHDYLVGYREQWGEGPFMTADALVQVGGKVLLITRGKEYGQGLIAMPGGFVHADSETFLDASVRELKEETRLKVPVPVLKGSIKNTFLADAVHRSDRGRLVSNVYHYQLANDTKLPEVRGSDDADKAEWYDVAWVLENRDKFFEDHYHIIKAMLGLN